MGSQGGFVPRRPSKISSKGKEKWIKDLVSRKKYTSSKYRGPFSPSLQKNQYRPETTSQAVTTTTTTKAQEVKENKNEVALDDAANELLLSLFAPTMPPKTAASEDKNERHRLVSENSPADPDRACSVASSTSQNHLHHPQLQQRRSEVNLSVNQSDTEEFHEERGRRSSRATAAPL